MNTLKRNMCAIYASLRTSTLISTLVLSTDQTRLQNAGAMISWCCLNNFLMLLWWCLDAATLNSWYCCDDAMMLPNWFLDAQMISSCHLDDLTLPPWRGVGIAGSSAFNRYKASFITPYLFCTLFRGDGGLQWQCIKVTTDFSEKVFTNNVCP